MTLIASQNLLNGIQSNIQSFTNDLLIQYISNPLGTDDKINKYVISQVGEVPSTDKTYFQNCGTFFLRTQSCEHRDRIRTETIKARDDYFKKYQAVRIQLMNGLTAKLKADPNKEQYKTAFVAGNKSLQETIDKIAKNFERNIALGQTIWSLAKSIPVIGQVVGFSQQFLTKDRPGLSAERPDLHRFSEIPPEILTRNPIDFIPQWFTVILTVRTLEIAREYGAMYAEAYPVSIAQNLVQSIGNNGKTIALAAVGFAILKKINK